MSGIRQACLLFQVVAVCANSLIPFSENALPGVNQPSSIDQASSVDQPSSVNQASNVNQVSSSHVRFVVVDSPATTDCSTNSTSRRAASKAHCLMLCANSISCSSASFAASDSPGCALSNSSNCQLNPRATLYRKIVSSVSYTPCQVTIDDRKYLVIQQRKSYNLNFGRSWTEYETGFGSCSDDFWIGLNPMSFLTSSSGGLTLRIEMKTSYAISLLLIYSGLKIGGSCTNYTMTYASMIGNNRSSTIDPMSTQKGMQFSTLDRDNGSGVARSCSHRIGAGWWINNCADLNLFLNGLAPTATNDTWKISLSKTDYSWDYISSSRMLLAIN